MMASCIGSVGICLMLLCDAFNTVLSISPHPLLLIVVFDGFRHSFLDEKLTPNLWRLAKDGVRLDNGMRSQMLPVTAPSHYSMATGLYAENHGIVGNVFYDPELDAKYAYWPEGWNAPEFDVPEYRKTLSSFYKSEPIWVTNEKKSETGNSLPKRASGSMNWPHTDVPINGQVPRVLRVQESCCDEKDNLTAWKTQFQEITTWFLRETDPINFALFYVSQPDHAEHSHGTKDERTVDVIKSIDKLAKYVNIFNIMKLMIRSYKISQLYLCKSNLGCLKVSMIVEEAQYIGEFFRFMREEMERQKLWDKLNLIFTADHGFVDVKYPEGVIGTKDLFAELGITDKAEWSCGGKCIVFKDKSIVSSTYTKVKDRFDGKVDVYLKNSTDGKNKLDRYFHYYENNRIGDIVFLEKTHYLDITFTENSLKDIPSEVRGQHSFSPDRPEMRPLLFFHGPVFKTDFLMSGRDVQNVDLYPLMCHILNIEALPNNGTLHHLWPAFAGVDGKLAALMYSLFSSQSVSLLIMLSVMLPAIAFLCYLVAFCRTSRTPIRTPGGETRYTPLESEFSDLRPSGRTANGASRGRSRPLLEIEGNIESMSEDEL